MSLFSQPHFSAVVEKSNKNRTSKGDAVQKTTFPKVDLSGTRTEWFDGTVSPVHHGWYERRLKIDSNRQIAERLAIQYWNGKNWGQFFYLSKTRQLKQSGIYSDWRGVIRQRTEQQERGSLPTRNKEKKNALGANKLETLIKKPHFVDGLNVAHWGSKNQVDLAIVLTLVLELRKRGVKFVVIFDASAQYKFKHEVYGKLISEFHEYFCETPGKIKADEFLLQRAQSTGGVIVSNDQFREYAERYPWLNSPFLRLVKGIVVGENLTIPDLKVDRSLQKDLDFLYKEFSSRALHDASVSNGNQTSAG